MRTVPLTKIVLAAAFILLPAVLIFGYAREFVPSDNALVVRGEFELEAVDTALDAMQNEDGVQAVEVTVMRTDADREPFLWGYIQYDGFRVWLSSDEDEAGRTLSATPYHRRYSGRPDPSRLGEAMKRLGEVLLTVPGARLEVEPAEDVPGPGGFTES
jgi:hypothetical protein